MDQLLLVLGQLGVGVASSAIVELIKTYAQEPSNPSVLVGNVQKKLDEAGLSLDASNLLTELQQRGLIGAPSGSVAIKLSGSGSISSNRFFIGEISGFDKVIESDSTGLVSNNTFQIDKANRRGSK